MSRIRLTKQTANPPAPATDGGTKTVELFAAEVSSVIKPKAIDSDGNVTDFVGPQGVQGIQGPPGPTGPPGTVTVVDVADIFNPTELNALTLLGIGGAVYARQVVGAGGADLITAYLYDANGPAVNMPYSVATGDGGTTRWVASVSRFTQTGPSAADGSRFISAAEISKIFGIEAGAQVNPASASQAEAEAGTEVALRTFSPLRIAQAIAALSAFDPSKVTEINEDWITGNEDTDEAGRLGWRISTAGTGASTARQPGVAGHDGIMRLNCGTAATARGVLHLVGAGLGAVVVGGGEIFVDQVVRVTGVLANHERTIIGLADELTVVGDFVNGIYFQLLGGATPDTNWHLVTANAGARTRRDTGIAYSTGGWIRLGFKVNAAGTSVQAYVNGVSAGAPITTDIPTSAIGPILKNDALASGGGVSISLDSDYFNYRRVYTTPR